MRKHITWLLAVTGFFTLIVISAVGTGFWHVIKALFLDGDINKIIIENSFERGSRYHSSIPGYIFVILKIVLNMYFLMLLIKAFSVLRKMRSGKIIFKDQSKKIEFVGSGIIAYASIQFFINIIFGTTFFNDIWIISEGLIRLLLYCIVGKLLLLAASISLKAEDYKTENDLTV